MTRNTLVLGLLVGLPAVAAARAPVPVSPGSIAAQTTAASPCPTFSWTATAGAGALELAVYGIDEAGQVEARPVLRQRLPGAALSWTPPLEECLEAGGRYAWTIRAVGETAAGGWSEPSVFRIAARPAEGDLEAALAVVQRYLAGPSPGSARPAAREALQQARRTTIADGSGSPRESASTPPGATTRSPTESGGNIGMEIRVDDGSDVSFGLYGVSAADELGSAGVVGESSALAGTTYGVIGRHSGLLVGSGAAGAFSSTGGGDILQGFSNETLVFQVTNGGTVALSGDLSCSSCIDGSAIQSGSLTGSDIANGTITASDIANGTITGADVANNSIGENDLGNGSVGGDELDAIYVVSVECNGECSDLTLGQACAVSGAANRRPIAVDCQWVDADSGSACGGDNSCASFVMSSNSMLSAFCDDGSGWDAQVYCLDDDE